MRYWVLNHYSEFVLFEYSMIVRKNALIEHLISTQNLDLLSTQSWVLNFYHFFVGNWELNNPNIEWTLSHANTATFQKLSFHQFSSSLLTYFLKSKTLSVIPFWRAFLMHMRGVRSKVPLSWLFQCQDWFTKSGGHLRILKLETWYFACDLISPIHMLHKNVGLIWEHFEILVQPNCHQSS